jgi:hypothetical protein
VDHNTGWPRYFKQAVDVYLYVEEKAVQTDAGLIFTGSMRDVRMHLGIPIGSWGHIKTLLQDTVPTVDENGNSLAIVEPCLTLFKRGGGKIPSEWLINRPISELDLNLYRPPPAHKGLTIPPRAATVVSDHESRIAELESRVSELESRLRYHQTGEKNAKAT